MVSHQPGDAQVGPWMPCSLGKPDGKTPQEAGSEGDGTGETALLWGSSQRALAPERDHDSSSLLRKVLAFKSFTHIVGQR